MIVNEGKYYLYRHVRKDNSQPFYIGIGTKVIRGNQESKKQSSLYYRAYCKEARNSIWKKIVNKTDYEVEILLESNDYEFIKQKEIEFIALYGRKSENNGILSNITEGGEGNNFKTPYLNSILKKRVKVNKNNSIAIDNLSKRRIQESKEKYEGKQFTLKNGESVTIVEYIKSDNVIVIFKDGNLKKTSINALNKKSLKHPIREKDGVGIVEKDKYKSFINGMPTKYYSIWSRVLNKNYEKGISISGYTVCKEWHNFQNFAEWCNKKYKLEINEKWVFSGNVFKKDTEINPENSMFLPKEILALFNSSYTFKKGRYNKYCAVFRSKHIGYFEEKEEAITKYLEVKNNYFQNLVEKYKDDLQEKDYNKLKNFIYE